MSRITPFAIGLALPISLMSHAALADLTPAQVWGDWRQYMEGMGYNIIATETANGPDLAVSGIILNFGMPDTSGTASLSLGTLNYRQLDDGTVAIDVPGVMPLTLEGAAEDERFALDMVLTQTGHSTIASGSPDNITYTYAAETMGLVLQQLMLDDETFGAENARINISANALSSQTNMRLADVRGYAQNGVLGDMTYDIFVNNPEDTSQVTLKGAVQNVTWEGDGALPLSVMPGADMSAMIRAGFEVAGGFAYGSGNTQINVVDPVNGDFDMQTSSQGGELGVAIGPDGLNYSGSQDDIELSLTAQDLPFPVALQMGRQGFNLNAPVLKSEEPQDFSFGLTMGDFTMSDMIWSIFDPAGQLPRDPVTLDLDIAGKAKLDVDYLDPETAAQIGTDAPGEVQELTINKLLLDAVGARLEGSGAVTLDNTDTSTVPGMPKPVGSVSFALSGGNALLDKLVAMGLLPQDQAMGARMMMGLFAVPGTEPDTLNSEIVFTEDGQILANGQRIR